MSSDSGGRRDKNLKERQTHGRSLSENGSHGKKLMEMQPSKTKTKSNETCFSSDELYEIQTVDGILSSIPELSEMCQSVSCDQQTGFEGSQRQLCNFKDELSKILQNLEKPGMFKDLAQLLNKDFKTFITNVLVITKNTSSRSQQNNSNLYLNLAALINHLKKLINVLLHDKNHSAKIIEPRQNLLTNLSTIFSSCEKEVKAIKDFFSKSCKTLKYLEDSFSFPAELLWYTSNDTRSYLQCIEFAAEKLQSFQLSVDSVCQISVNFLDFNKAMMQFLDIFRHVSVSVSQCLNMHKWGIDAHDEYEEMLMLSKFVDVCFSIEYWLEKRERKKISERFAQVLSLTQSRHILSADVVSLANQVKDILLWNDGKVTIPLSQLKKSLTKDIVPKFTTMNVGIPKFSEAYICLLQSVQSFFSERRKSWLNGESYPANNSNVIAYSFDFCEQIRLDYIQLKITNFEHSLVQSSTFQEENVQIDIYSCRYICIQQLQLLQDFMKKMLPFQCEDLRNYSTQVKEFQKLATTVVINLVNFLNLGLTDRAQDSFKQETEHLKNNLMLSLKVEQNDLEGYLEVVSTHAASIIGMLSSTELTISPKANYSHKQDLIITQQDPSLHETHVFMNFDVIVPRKVWKLVSNAQIKMGMSFFIPTFNMQIFWEHLDCNPKRHGNDFSVMTCGLAISNNLRGRKLYYKYMVFQSSFISPEEMIYLNKPVTDEVNHCYRLFSIPTTSSVVSIYDSCIYPQELASPSIIGWVVSHFTSNNTLQKPEMQQNEQEYCIKAHLLDVYKQIFQGEVSSEDDLIAVYRTITMVFSSFSNAKKVNIKSSPPKEIAFFNASCIEIFQEDLMMCIKKLKCISSPLKIISSLALCRCFADISEVCCSENMLKLLSVHYDEEARQCHEYDIILSVLPNFKLRDPFIQSIPTCIQNVLLNSKRGSIPWISIIQALPLYHLFSTDPPKTPFCVLDIAPKHLSLEIQKIQALDLFTLIKKSDIVEIINHLTSIELIGDPFLQLTLLAACLECKEMAYSLLLGFVAIPAIIWGLAIKIANTRKISSQFFEISNLMDEIWKRKEKLEFDMHHDSSIESLVLLMTELTNKSKEVCLMESTWMKVSTKCIQLILFLINDVEDKKKQEILCSTSPFITAWVSLYVGENFSSGKQQILDKELKFWTNLYTLCNNSLAWNSMLNEIVSQRFEKISNFHSQITIFESLISNSEATDSVRETTRNVLEQKVLSASLKELRDLANTSHSKECRSIICRLVDDKFPSLPSSLDDILVWDQWPIVLTALVDIPSKHPESICHSVKQILEQAQQKIESGDITVRQLYRIRKKWDSQIIQIFASLSLDQFSFVKCLEDNENKLLIFNFYFHLLSRFANKCAEKLQVSQILLKKLEQLEKQQPQMNVNCLCSYENESLTFPEFFEADSIIPILIPFTIMSSDKLQNDIFHQQWQKLFKIAAEDFTFSDVCQKIWYPLFDYCSNLMDSLKDETITLAELGRLFGSTESADREQTITNLYLAIMKCRSANGEDIIPLIKRFTQFWDQSVSTGDKLVEIVSIPTSIDTTWIKEISKKIDQWNSLRDLANEADQVIDTLATYGVNGDCFHIFSSQTIQAFLHQKLNTVTEENEQVLSFLKASKCQARDVKESIKKLGQSKELRQWIKTKSKDVSEMERFIGIALDTVAGEGIDVQDRLIDLSELCAKFSPLLYLFDDSMKSLFTFLQLLQQTWESLKSCDDPLTLVDTCISNFAWFQFIGQLQGAGEQGTVKQLEDINSDGEYTIETNEHSLGCLVYLRIIVSNNDQISKKYWTLDDLHELESKLVLITRQTSPWVDKKQTFQEILLRVCQMSDAIQKLKEYGHMAFLNWSTSIPCSTYLNDPSHLDEMIDEFENVLMDWIYNVWSCRYHYSELNFYTTNQLILLRKEFTLIQQNKSCEISPQVFHLLCSAVGKPVDSTMLIKKALTEDWNDFKNSEEDILDLPIADTSQDVVIQKEEKTQIVTKISQARDQLTNAQMEVFDELTSCGYDDYIILEAISLGKSDVYTAMDWIDELSNDQFTIYKSQWIEEQSNCTLNIPENVQPEDFTINTPQLPEEFDISPIATSFFKKNKRGNLIRSLSVDKDDYISLETLGKCLKNITKRRGSAKMGDVRQLPDFFERGTPNLVITAADTIFLRILQIYAQDSNKSLPSYDEILLCSESTTLEQVIIFLMRALYSKENNRIYCLVHAEKLTYLIAEKAMDLLKYLSHGIQDYQLVIICSNEGEEKSHIVSRLNSYRREWNLPSEEDKEQLKLYLKQHITQQEQNASFVNASVVDPDDSRIRIVMSTQSGVGKSLYIRKMKDKLVKILKQKEKQSSRAMITVPLHGPVVTCDEILSMLLKEKSDLKSCIIHIDIPQKVLRTVDDILFSILILGGLSNSSGHVWRCHPSQLYTLEVTVPDMKTYIWNFVETRRVMNLMNLLPSTLCCSPQEMLQNMDEDSKMLELRTPMYQRVYQYLQLFDEKNYLGLDKFIFLGTLVGKDKECLQTIIRHTNISNPTWKEIRHFVLFLNIQLSACEQSSVIRRVKQLKQFIVEFMIIMSRDFATSSMSLENKSDTLDQHIPRQTWEKSMHPYLFFNKNRTSITHVGLSLEIHGKLGYVIVDTYTRESLGISLSKEVFQFLSQNVKIPIGYNSNPFSSEELLRRLLDFMNIKLEEGKKIESPDKSYVLTHDNLTKIMAIQTRFRCQIPVVLMGETGCGKTHLIRFMCKASAYEKFVKNMFIVKVHGGTTEDDVIKCLEEAEKQALQNRKLKVDTIVFFDEANTSNVISLIKEIMCDGRCRGKIVPPFLKFVAACNPYRRHSDEMIRKLKGAGLGWRDEDPRDSTEKLGEIPLRDLVYRVLELPDSMKALVYDFGQLKYETEKEYILQMVRNKCSTMLISKGNLISDDVLLAIANVLAECQDYMKKKKVLLTSSPHINDEKDECSFVSLRDVERTLIIFIYFFETFTKSFIVTDLNHINQLTQSLLLALEVSYVARMSSQSDPNLARVSPQNDFLCFVVKTITQSTSLSHISTKEYNDLLYKYQSKLLDGMEIEENIAKNAALRENVFMMFVCIELRIPLFLIGKPGSSKSLAKTIIESSMKGRNSKKKIMKQFKQVHLHSHQCSSLSTPASIKEAFVNAKTFQEKKKDTKSFVSVVVLDEVGLAETSPYLPLKALHPLLEDGTEGSGTNDQRISREERVAFIGISNWALDPAKMNRGIMVIRSDPTIDDLIESAKGICSNKEGQEDPVLSRLKGYFPQLARSYHNICTSQKREFFGLRDFYSLIKMLYWMSYTSGSILTRAQIEHAIRRNFSGFDEFDPIAKFDLEELKERDQSHLVGLSASLKKLRTKDVIMLQREISNEYLIVDKKGELEFSSDNTKNAYFIVHFEDKTASFQSAFNNSLWIGTHNVDGTEILIVQNKEVQFNIFDSKKGTISLCTHHQFPCIAQINGIKDFMPVIPDDALMNPDCSPLGLIHESLSNRETTYHGESRYLLFLTDNYSSLQVLKHYVVTTCLQSANSSMDGQSLEPFVLFGSSFPRDSEFAQVCQNISEIRLCMEAGRMVILLNLENLYESLYDVLNQYYIKSGGHRYVDLGLRTNRMKCTVHQQFKLILIAEKGKVYEEFPTPLINRLEKHFVNTETVLTDWQRSICNNLEKWIYSFVDHVNGFNENDAFIGYSPDTKAAVVLQANILLKNNNPSFTEGSPEWNHKVFQICKWLFLQIASPDAIVRCVTNDKGKKHLQDIYFIEQEHSSLAELINRIKPSLGKSLLLQVTTHSSTLSQDEVDSLASCVGRTREQINRLHLEAFQTEQDFLRSIDTALERGKFENHLVIFECEGGHECGNLITCCRYRLVDKLSRADDSHSTSFVFLIHLPKKSSRMNFVSFQEQPWLCYHVDGILPSEDSVSLADFICREGQLMSNFYLCEKGTFTILPALQQSIEDVIIPEPYLLKPLVTHDTSNNMNLCKRMHHYISDAVSKSISENEHGDFRLKCLMKVIPEHPIFPLSDELSFFGLTVQLVKKSLQEREKTLQNQNWITEEAMNMQRLQEAGTFLNALLRKYDKLVIPILAQIISFVDRNSNLKLLYQDDSNISKLWMEIYSSQHLFQSLFEFTKTSIKKNTIASMVAFECQFPFSWLVFETIVSEKDSTTLSYDDLLIRLVNTELNSYFKHVPNSEIQIFAEYYIHDFVHLVATKGPLGNDDYNKMISDCVRVMIADYVRDISQASLLEILVALHCAYSDNKAYFTILSELVFQLPTIIVNIKANTESIPEIKLLLVNAMKEILDSQYCDIKTPLNNGPIALRGWMQKLYEVHEDISAIVQNVPQLIPSQLLLKWQWVCVMKIFLEYVVLNNEGELIFFAKRIEKYMEKKDDDVQEFQTPNTLRTVAILLHAVENKLKKLPKNQQEPIQKSCWSFFLDVLSTLCVDGNTYNQELIDILIDSVFIDVNQPTKDDKLHTLVKNHEDQLCFLQSFVLKLVLRYKLSTSRNALHEIFERICKLNESSKMKKQDFLNIVVSNFKMHMTLFCYDKNGDVKTPYVTDVMLTRGHDNLLVYHDKPHSPEYLQAAAQIMVSIHILVNTMEVVQSSDLEITNQENTRYFICEAEKYLPNHSYNEEQTSNGPIWYLVRYIIRTFGVSTLLKISKAYKWVLPYDDSPKELIVDTAAVYNPAYESIRSAITRATKGDFNELNVKMESLKALDTIPLVLALWERVRLSYVSDLPSKKLSPEIIEQLTNFAEKCKLFKNNLEILIIVKSLIQNQQCHCFSQMQARKDDSIETTTYRMIILHSVLTVLANRKTTLKLFFNLLTTPESLKNCLLPAMPVQVHFRIRYVEDDFLQCIQGHQYTSEMLECPCLECGNIVDKCDNNEMRMKHEIQFGYIPLQSGVENPPIGITPAVSRIVIRCIIHSCLLWSACEEKNIKSIFHGRLDDFPSYFWRQIQTDLGLLSKATGRSIDEVSLLFHSVLREINQKSYGIQISQTRAVKYDKLTSFDECTEWEKHFYESYVKPIFEDTDLSIQQIVKGLSSKDYNQLFAATYVAPRDVDQFLWNVHPEPSTEQFCLKILNLQLAETNPVLFMFLSEAHSLEATQQIPDILNMQKMTQGIFAAQSFDDKTRRLIEDMPFSTFVTEDYMDDQQKTVYKQLLLSLQKAWRLCQHELLHNNRLKALKNEYIEEDITENTLMKYLIPTTFGPGVITTALIDHLVITHNKFIRQCRIYVEEFLKKKWLWKTPKVHLLKVDLSHIIKCTKKEFTQMLHSHSIYTFSSGNVKIEYNLDGLEKDLVQRFVLGKHIITHTLDIPQVTWRSQMYNTQTITSVKKNVPQRPLPTQARPEILSELKTISDITNVCELVETVMRFLQRKGDDPQRKIKNYIEVDLQMTGKLRSKKVADYCCLEHVVALWKFLNVERAKIKVRDQTNPFSVLRAQFAENLEHQNQMLSLEKAVSKMSNLNFLLEVMYEFIQTYVQLCDVKEAKKPLKNVLLEFIRQTKSDWIVSSMEFFPQDIILNQVADTWKQIVHFQDAIKKTIQ